MTTTINNSYSAIVPAVYGTATPVIDVGRGAGSANAVVTLTRAGAVVVNLGSAPAGAVTYTASGLMHEMSSSSVPVPTGAQAAALAPAEKSAASATAEGDSEPPMLGQGVETAISQPAPVMAGGTSVDGVYDGGGVFMPAMGISVQTFQIMGSGAGDGSAGNNGGGAVGSLVSTAV